MKERAKQDYQPKKKKETAYFCKRVLMQAAVPAVRKAYRESMDVAGFVVQAKNGWVVKVSQDGTETRISKLEAVDRTSNIALD